MLRNRDFWLDPDSIAYGSETLTRYPTCDSMLWTICKEEALDLAGGVPARLQAHHQHAPLPAHIKLFIFCNSWHCCAAGAGVPYLFRAAFSGQLSVQLDQCFESTLSGSAWRMQIRREKNEKFEIKPVPASEEKSED